MRAEDIRLHFNGVFSRRARHKLAFATDRYGDYDLGAALGLISYIGRKDAARHVQILSRSLSSSRATPKLLLEVGCGLGGYVAYLAERLGVPAIGIDLSSVAISSASCRYSRAKEIGFLSADARQIPLADRTVSAAISLDTLNLCDDGAQQIIREVRRVLAPDGSFLFTVLLPTPINLASNWEEAIREAGLCMVAYRDLTAGWQNHMLSKHRWRWDRRERLRSVLGNWIEPDLAVSKAMLGLNGGDAIAMQMVRIEYVARRNA